jgi:hypothetical protein
VTTRTWVGVFLGIALPLWTAAASAETYVKYRDITSGCELFVDRGDLIPRKARDGARIVSEVEARMGIAAATACLQSGRLPPRSAGDSTTGESGPNAAVIDARVMSKSGRALSEGELAALRQLSSPRVSAYILATLAALVAWIAVMVAAFREDHLGWAMFTLILSAPGALIYLAFGLDKDRCRFKLACALGILSPLLVFLANVCCLFPPAAK